jgi:hypothetical protein
MNMRDPEYDAFGPWIIEISELDPPPPLFRPYLTREEIPLLSIKIPRKIERRLAHPGMNLYDYMVTLYQEDFVILQRVENDVRSEAFYYRDIQYIRYGEHLLKGNLHLAMRGKVFDVPFNTVSTKIMHHLVSLIRERYTNGEAQATMSEEIRDIAEGDLSYYFTRLLAQEKAKYPERRVLATQTETSIGSFETRTFRKLLFGIISKLLLESLHLSDGRELKIISRGKTYRYKGQSIHGLETCYIPTSKISGVTWEADTKNTAVLNLTLQTAGGSVSYTFVRENRSIRSYASFLSAVTGLSEGLEAASQTQPA